MCNPAGHFGPEGGERRTQQNLGVTRANEQEPQVAVVGRKLLKSRDQDVMDSLATVVDGGGTDIVFGPPVSLGEA